jgi:hypothetical protein
MNRTPGDAWTEAPVESEAALVLTLVVRCMILETLRRWKLFALVGEATGPTSESEISGTGGFLQDSFIHHHLGHNDFHN